jgi:hypothetical protein
VYAASKQQTCEREPSIVGRGMKILSSTPEGVFALFFACLHVAICFCFAPFGFNDYFHDGLQLRVATDIVEGATLFKDTFTIYGFLPHHLHALVLKGFGVKLISVKYYYCCLYFIISIVNWYVLRRFLSIPFSGVAFLLWICLAPHYIFGVIIWPQVEALLFQLLALLMGFYLIDTRKIRYAFLAGIAVGLTWCSKQNIGFLTFVGFGSFLLVWWLFVRDGSARVGWRFPGAFVAGFIAPVSMVLVVLFFSDSVGDWYRQTIHFPPLYYTHDWIQRSPSYGFITGLLGEPGSFGALKRVTAMLISWYSDLVYGRGVSQHWVVMWVFVVFFALRYVLRSLTERLDYVLVVCVSVLTYLSLLPSNNVMHQWWLVTPILGPFLSLFSSRDEQTLRRTQAVLSAVLLFFIFAHPIHWNITTGLRQQAARTTVIREPPVLAGMRTDAGSAAALKEIHDVVVGYVARYPGTRLITLDGATPNALLMLCFPESNRSPYRLPWAFPVMSTLVYPGYAAHMSGYIGAQRPLIIHWLNPGEKRSYERYRVLRTVQSPHGNGEWMIFCPAEHYINDPETTVRTSSTEIQTRESMLQIDQTANEGRNL